MKKIINIIGLLRLQVIGVIITLLILCAITPFACYVLGGCILLFSILNMLFVLMYLEHMMLRLCYDKYNKYDVYHHILHGTWKATYNTPYNDQLAFMLFDKVGSLVKNIHQIKILRFQQEMLLRNFPTLSHLEENQWILGKNTSVMVMRKGNSYQYKNNYGFRKGRQDTTTNRINVFQIQLIAPCLCGAFLDYRKLKVRM